MQSTADDDYTQRLASLSGARWKRIVGAQIPYRWNLRRQRLGRTLDIGCGIGRNLQWLERGSVGVDHNAMSVQAAREQGLVAFTTEEWRESSLNRAGAFDSLLLAHVAEHMTFQEAVALLRDHVPSLRVGGRAFLICPQERGFHSDATHVEWFDMDKMRRLVESAGLRYDDGSSFPLPRRAGVAFTYNEFNLTATLLRRSSPGIS